VRTRYQFNSTISLNTTNLLKLAMRRYAELRRPCKSKAGIGVAVFALSVPKSAGK
jgi:hypothetical protein